MFLAHFSGWSYSDLMEMSSAELYFWANEAHKLHNELNRTE